MATEDEEDLAFDVRDYIGVRVRCTTDRWQEKIIDRHSELASRRDDIIQAVTNPTIVLQDRDFPGRRHFLRPAGDLLYLVVVVEYPYVQPPVVGRFITAFFRRRLRSDDRVIYSAVPR